MSTPEERIQALADKSAIAPADVARLLAAVRPAALPARDRKNPFERMSGERAAALGVGIALALAALSAFKVRTTGVFDLQNESKAVSLATGLLDQAVAYPFVAIVFWSVGRFFARRVRFVDVLGAIGLSRAAALVGAAWLAFADHALLPHVPARNPVAIVVLLPALIATGLHIFLVVLGFRTATGLRGGKLALAVVLAGLVAETLAKVGIFLIDR